MSATRWTVAVAAVLLAAFLGAEPLLAQGQGGGPGNNPGKGPPFDPPGPPPIPPGLSDRATLPPGKPFSNDPRDFTPPGQRGRNAVSLPVTPQMSAAASRTDAALGARSLATPSGLAFAPGAQAAVRRTLASAAGAP